MQQAPRRTSGLLSSLLGPLLYAADDVVEAYRRPATSQGRALAIAGPGQEAPGCANSPVRMAQGDLKMMGNDSSAQSGTSTHSQASADDALLLKRRQVSVTRCERLCFHTRAHPGTCVRARPAAERGLLTLRQPLVLQGGQLRPTGLGLRKIRRFSPQRVSLQCPLLSDSRGGDVSVCVPTGMSSSCAVPDSGLYICTSISPSGPAYGKLKIGDILDSVDGGRMPGRTAYHREKKRQAIARSHNC
jgi:hypothetical protein